MSKDRLGIKWLPEQYRHYDDIGVMRRYNHEECGDGKERLYVTRTETGWIFHCHNCAPVMSGRYISTKGDTPPSQTAKLIEATSQPRLQIMSDEEKVKLPEDFTLQIPREGASWLMSYGITEDEKKRYGIGFSPSLNRLILPVYREGVGLVFWQGRYLGKANKKKPKYLSVMAKGQDKLFEIKNGNARVVVVEDILSAIKVGRHTSAIALLGSYLPTTIYKRLSDYNKVGLWLDYDKYKDAVAYAKRLREFGHSVINIHTPLDPKEQTDQAIISLTSF